MAVTGTVGAFDSVMGRYAFDGVAGAHTHEGPTMDIANGGPSGIDAPKPIVIGWIDGQEGLNNQAELV